LAANPRDRDQPRSLPVLDTLDPTHPSLILHCGSLNVDPPRFGFRYAATAPELPLRARLAERVQVADAVRPVAPADGLRLVLVQ
jgi:hypothetical protein